MTPLDIQFTPSQPRTLHFYNRKRRCVKTVTSTEILPFNAYSDKQFRTAKEYIIAIESILASHTLYVPTEHWEDDGKWPQPYSFIEVFNKGQFQCRHYVRHGKLTPFQFSGPIDTDLYIAQQLTAASPGIDWRRVTHDAMFNHSGVWRKGIKLREFVELYSI